MKWSDLTPGPAIVRALEHAGPKPADSATQNEKRNWSDAFADGCAIAVANEFRQHPELGSKRILPRELGSGTEPLTPLGAGTEKRIDVTVADAVLGLEVGVSLKGLNFKDQNANNYDKNLTGRLYELNDEVRMVHEHLPHAFIAAMMFLPLESTRDKRSEASDSSFARAVIKLRDRTGRLDAALHAHASRCDAAYVGVYVLGEPGDPFPRGVCRFINVHKAPPKRGRPQVEHTLSLAELVAEVVAHATSSVEVAWSEPEPD
jgi:hypothetical protein